MSADEYLKQQETALKSAVLAELARAEELGYEKKFHSKHEKFAVMMEEFEEFLEAVEYMKKATSDLWKSVKTDDEQDYMDFLSDLIFNSKQAYVELIHTIAMLKKEIEKC